MLDILMQSLSVTYLQLERLLKVEFNKLEMMFGVLKSTIQNRTK
jgi:hypothetical protein